ncbi:MAG: hypothetical protein U0790_20190 [Isosphaeraceae bacterium]
MGDEESRKRVEARWPSRGPSPAVQGLVRGAVVLPDAAARAAGWLSERTDDQAARWLAASSPGCWNAATDPRPWPVPSRARRLAPDVARLCSPDRSRPAAPRSRWARRSPGRAG